MHLKTDLIYFNLLNSSNLESLRAYIDYFIDVCFKMFLDVLNVFFSF